MLPFELPTNFQHLQWRRRKTSEKNTETPKLASPAVLSPLSDDDLLSIPNSRPPSRASSNHSNAQTTTTAQFTITPDVPHDILAAVDEAVGEDPLRTAKP